MGSDESHFNVSVGSDGQSDKTVSTDQKPDSAICGRNLTQRYVAEIKTASCYPEGQTKRWRTVGSKNLLESNKVISQFEEVLLVEFIYLVFTRMPCESYRRRLRPLLLYYVFRELINSLVCWYFTVIWKKFFRHILPYVGQYVTGQFRTLAKLQPWRYILK